MKIHLDFDETLVHSMCANNREHAKEIIELWHGFGNTLFLLDDGYYVTFLRSFTHDLVKFCQDLVGIENVFICSIGTKDYIEIAVKNLGINIAPERINGRYELGGDEHSSYDQNILIDNWGYWYHTKGNRNKVNFLALKHDNLIQTEHFYAQQNQKEEKDEFEVLKTRIQSRYEYYNRNK